MDYDFTGVVKEGEDLTVLMYAVVYVKDGKVQHVNSLHTTEEEAQGVAANRNKEEGTNRYGTLTCEQTLQPYYP